MPAPRGNLNAVRHGLRSSQVTEPGINGQLRALRRACRTELVGPNGSLTLAQEATLQSLLRHEARALLAARWLRIETGLAVAQRLELLATVTTATEQRDKLLQRLGIMGDSTRPAGSSLWDALDSSRDEEHATPDSPAGEREPPETEQTPSEAASASETQSGMPGQPITPASPPSFDPRPYPGPGEDIHALRE